MFGPGAMRGQRCDICDNEQLLLRWTLAHGHAECIYCHAPYVVLFYENGERVRRNDPPELNLKPESVELFKRCWKDLQLPVSSPEATDWFKENDPAFREMLAES
jgi:hypothetical protein